MRSVGGSSAPSGSLAGERVEPPSRRTPVARRATVSSPISQGACASRKIFADYDNLLISHGHELLSILICTGIPQAGGCGGMTSQHPCRRPDPRWRRAETHQHQDTPGIGAQRSRVIFTAGGPPSDVFGLFPGSVGSWPYLVKWSARKPSWYAN